MSKEGYRLFIDDDSGEEGIAAFRNPPDDGNVWKVARTSDEAISIVKQFGIPNFIDFDHDLGVKEDGTVDTSMLFLKWWSDYNPYGIQELMNNASLQLCMLAYRIHSKNPVGAQNIDSYLASWYASLKL